jgi:hypothetical protein
MGCDIHPYVEVRKDGKWERSTVKVPSDRDYWAFGKLANVRNGEGFAGCDTGDLVTPISQPRGLPDDTSIHDNDSVDYEDPAYVWLGDHSFSWVLLSELLAVDYNEKVNRRGMAKPEIAAHLAQYGVMPWNAEWCAWTTDKAKVAIAWSEPLMKAASLLPEIICAVCHLGKPEDVRIVFGFDS